MALSSFARRVDFYPTNLAERPADLFSAHMKMISPSVAIHVGPAAVLFYAPESTISLIPYFREALQRGPQAATNKKLTLREDRPEIFTALLEHLSTGSYTYTYDPATTVTDDTSAPTPDLVQGYFHVSVFRVAHAYGWQPLVDDAVNNFLFVLANLAGMDIVRLWKEAYGYGLTVPVCERDGGLVDFAKALPALLKGLYETDGPEMTSTVMRFPAMADDFMRLPVSSQGK